MAKNGKTRWSKMCVLLTGLELASLACWVLAIFCMISQRIFTSGWLGEGSYEEPD